VYRPGRHFGQPHKANAARNPGVFVAADPKTVRTAAIAGYCIWSLIQYSNSRRPAENSSRLSDAERNRRLQEDISRGAGIPDDEGHARPGT
jgi:hypothetical protein